MIQVIEHKQQFSLIYVCVPCLLVKVKQFDRL